MKDESKGLPRTSVRGRFAPSPTGPLHLGHAQTMLLCWLQVRALGGALVLRIEDVDRGRIRPGAEEQIFRDLAWLGFDWDEGPDVGGDFGPYRQSERADRYAAALEALSDRTFECTCTRKEVRLAAGLVAEAGTEVPYSGTCRLGVADPDRPERAVRVRVDPGQLHWDDLWQGPSAESPAALCGDFILRTKQGDTAYQLACSVDDIAMGITHILRGQDLASSNGRQMLLHRWLDASYSPLFAHTPLRVDDDGVRLAKSRGSVGICDLRDAGEDPKVLLAELALGLGLIDTVGEALVPSDLLSAFVDQMPQLLRRS
jgi:glutamyl-tRNA synthetase